jgi:hypothetical protein
VTVAARSEFDGWEANGVVNFDTGRSYRVDLLAGFRYLSLQERLDIAETSLVSSTSPIYAGSGIQSLDTFDMASRFYGGQIGARAEFYNGRFFVNTTAKVALGVTQELLNVNGTTLYTPPVGQPQFLPGGLLALPSNSGNFNRDRFSVVPEFGLNVGYEVMRSIRVTAGYSLIYWNHVLRIGDQLDRVVNVSQISTSVVKPAGGPDRPAVLFADTSFWAQGLTFGVEFRY